MLPIQVYLASQQKSLYPNIAFLHVCQTTAIRVVLKRFKAESAREETGIGQVLHQEGQSQNRAPSSGFRLDAGSTLGRSFGHCLQSPCCC